MPKKSTHQDDIDLSRALTGVISEIVSRTPSLSHIDVGRVLVCVGSNRKNGRGGIYGKLIPLRFENGSTRLLHRGRTYANPEITHDGKNCLYVLYFYMPRFFDLPWEGKLRVLFHELFHISPRFDGDIRRMGAVKSAHGHSKRHFDTLFSAELRAFAPHAPSLSHFAFLSMNSSALYRSYRSVTGIRMKSPRPVPVGPS